MYNVRPSFEIDNFTNLATPGAGQLFELCPTVSPARALTDIHLPFGDCVPTVTSLLSLTKKFRGPPAACQHLINWGGVTRTLTFRGKEPEVLAQR